MSSNPLHLEPVRPIVDAEWKLLNPIGIQPFIELHNHQSVGYDDLQPLATYVSLGLEYITDAVPVPARVRGALRLVPSGSRVRHGEIQRGVGRLGLRSVETHHGGHIVAVSLGGYPSGPNLFPQAANFNVSAFARLEYSWRQALVEGGSVEVDIALTEGESLETPSFVVVTHWEDGVEETLVFPNEGHVL